MTHLVPDKRPGVFQRRQATCALNEACELGWVRACGSAQARCPAGCPAYSGPGIVVLPEEPPEGALGPAATCDHCGSVLGPQPGPGRKRRYCAGTRCKQQHAEALVRRGGRA